MTVLGQSRRTKQAAASPDVRFTSNSDQTGASQRSDALCQQRNSPRLSSDGRQVPRVPLAGPREDDGKCAPYPSYLPPAPRFQREDGGCCHHSFQIRLRPLAKVRAKAETDCANRLHTNPRAGGKRCTTKPENFPR